MKKNLLVRAMLVAVLLVCCNSCDDREEIPSSQPKSEKVSCNPHAISQEQALASLQDFMNSFENVATRSAMQSRRVKDIYPVEFRKDVTRAGADTIDCENLLYVVNFENEQGYAILAADDRVKDDVLAVVEQGSMSPQAMKAAAKKVMITNRPIFSGFPITGPGYFQMPEYPGEIFMNPNTVDLADSIEGDTLVGNFDTTGLTVTEPNEPTFTPNPDVEPFVDLNGELTGSFVYENARNDLYDENHEESGKDTWKRDPNGHMEISYGDWKVAGSTALLLKDFTNWNQHAPYNNLYPMRSNWSSDKSEDQGKAYVGCVPLALAKVVLYLGVPQNYKGIDMAELKELSRDGKWYNNIAVLLYGISEDCHSKYFRNGTFTFPFRAKKFLKNHGYTKVDKREYSFSVVRSMIDKNHPIIMVSMPRLHITKSHSWNIDGYKIMQQEIAYRYYDWQNKLVRTDYYRKERNMVHCDFGWGGDHNGYYTSGVFKLNDPDAEFDNQPIKEKTTHYNNYKRIIYYDCL